MRTKITHVHRGWLLWIGGACFLIGSLVAGSYGLASAGPSVSGTVIANQGTPGSSSWPVSSSQSGVWQQELTDGANVLGTSSHPLRTDPTGATTQPVNGSVGLNAGSNNIGSVGISGSLPAGTNDIGTVHVATPSTIIGSVNCTAADGTRSCDSGDPGLATGTVINTLSAECSAAAGQHVLVAYNTGKFQFSIPVSFQGSFNGIDSYFGSVSNLGFPIQTGLQFLVVAGDYIASGGNGADCFVSYVGTAPPS